MTRQVLSHDLRNGSISSIHSKCHTWTKEDRLGIKSCRSIIFVFDAMLTLVVVDLRLMTTLIPLLYEVCPCKCWSYDHSFPRLSHGMLASRIRTCALQTVKRIPVVMSHLSNTFFSKPSVHKWRKTYAVSKTLPPASVTFFSASLLMCRTLTTMGTSGNLPLPQSLP